MDTSEMTSDLYGNQSGISTTAAITTTTANSSSSATINRFQQQLLIIPFTILGVFMLSLNRLFHLI
ncbi:hypothetical protein I4U23_023980 [Adineta vaga]|nr:hypothetical protein I4U23_023980 [Adineta vaga]